MKCRNCNNPCVKKGVRNGIQKYLCKYCRKHQQKDYKYQRYTAETGEKIKMLNNEGASISSIARLTGIPKSTVQRKIFLLAQQIERPDHTEKGQHYEIDEMSITVAGKDGKYLIYAINRRTRQIIDFFIGSRTKENIKRVVDTVLKLDPERIYTDGLNSYPSLISKSIHKAGRQVTNRIERKNLSLRNFIKRLSRNTLCFSRSELMLEASLKLYCWG